MSEEKPISPYGEGGRVSENIEWYESGYRIVEHFDVSTNGATGLTRKINVFLPSQGIMQPPVNPLEPGNEHILEIIQNSSIREKLYQEKMNEVHDESIKNGNGDAFIEGLKNNGTFQPVFSTAEGTSINDIEIIGETTRNNNAIEAREEATLEALQAQARVYQEIIQVENEVLYYPNNLDDTKGEDYIFIEQFEYSPPQPLGTVKTGDVLDKGVPRTTNIKGNIEEPRGSCKLPIPNKLGVSNGVSWGEAKANAVELAAFSAAAGGVGGLIGGSTDIVKLFQEGLGSAGKIFENLKKDFKNTTGSEANSASVLSAAISRSLLGQIGINVDVDQFVTRQTGAAINPNLELLFGGPQLRTFSFNFNFAPEGPEEALMVRKIQRWFRQGMLPTRSGGQIKTGDRNLFLGSPNIFRIQYKNMSRRIKGLNIIKICALTSCQIDFTPDGTYQSYDDSKSVSMPVRSTMGLTFNELTPIFKDDYFTPQDGIDMNDMTPQSVKDLGSMVTGDDAINEHDIGF